MPPIAEPEQILSSLRCVFDKNVMGFRQGKLGAVNGMRPNGYVDNVCLQSVEVCFFCFKIIIIILLLLLLLLLSFLFLFPFLFFSFPSQVWTGTTYGLASTLIQEGLVEEGFRTAWGIVNTTYETKGSSLLHSLSLSFSIPSLFSFSIPFPSLVTL